MDMIRCPDAAQITIPGRGYFQVGNNELFESFQSGWSGAPYDPDANAGLNDADLRVINLQGKKISGKHKKIAPVSSNVVTQLDAMVKHIREVAQINNIKLVSPIWLPPLAERIIIKHDSLSGDDAGQSSLNAQIGFADDPNGQRQFPLVIDIISSGHMLIAAMAGGGKTTFLQTLLYSLVTTNDPTQINIYIIDFGSRNLGIFSALPHVGGVAFDSDTDKIDKLIAMLTKEVADRKLRFAEKGVGTFKEYRQESNDQSAVMLIIDNYSAFAENFVKHEETMISLAREAASFGVYMILTCLSAKEIRGRLRQIFNFGVGLQLNDRFEYEDVLGTRVEFTPDADMPGRGLVRSGGEIMEFQTALSVDAPNAASINSQLRSRFESIKMKWSGNTARPIPEVPEDMSIGAMMSNTNIKLITADGRYLPIGYDLSEAEPLYLDLAMTFCYTISGAERTGKTTLLKALMKLVKISGASCYIFDGPDNELRTFAQANDIIYLTTADELFSFMSDVIIPEFTRRNIGKEAFLQREERDIDTYLSSEQKIFIFINNMEAFCEAVYKRDKGMSGFMEQMLTKGDSHMIYLMACIANSDMTGEWNSRPFLRKFIGHRSGLHLGGVVDNQRIFDFEIPALERAKRLPPGKGFTIENGITKRVVTVY
jgi:S-DNA-T family DNA segregation ATPase FtsK/SpoIIIE